MRAHGNVYSQSGDNLHFPCDLIFQILGGYLHLARSTEKQAMSRRPPARSPELLSLCDEHLDLRVELKLLQERVGRTSRRCRAFKRGSKTWSSALRRTSRATMPKSLGVEFEGCKNAWRQMAGASRKTGTPGTRLVAASLSTAGT